MTLENQVISAYITQDFYVGSLGLSPSSVNIASFDDQFPSFLGTLKQQNQIPSNSYGYTAGASYRKFPASAYGSLTLGGYDSTRMDPSKNLTIPGADDNYRPLLLVIERITSESTELLDAPIVTALDSLVSHIWLPISACQHFESVFGLVWNPTFSLYIVNDTQHSALLEQNASVTFTLCTGSIQEKDDSLEITLPYAAFDLTAEPPFAGLNETVHYFPLKRAANDTQYTLGRTILQEMYMIADYDRDALSLFPAIFPDSSVEPNLVPIDPPGQVPGDPVPQNNALSIAAIVGIVVGVIAFLTLVAGGIWFYKRYSRREKANKAVLDLSFSGEKAELSSDGAFHGRELEGTVASVTTHPSLCPAGSTDCKDSQLDSSISSPLSEMPGDQGGSELCRHREIYEMP